MIGRASPSATEPVLLDVVPWSYGFAHSWALRWLLERSELAALVLGAIDGMPGKQPWSVRGAVDYEKSVRPARADLALEAVDASGSSKSIAVETKVGDPFRPEQLHAYVQRGYLPVVYLPGITGLVAEAISPQDELRLKGAQLARALDGVELPWLIGGYVADLRREGKRMDGALAAARAGAPHSLGPGRGDARAIRDVAWLIAVREALTKHLEADQGHSLGKEITIRVERNDRGLFWDGSWTDVPGGCGLYIDVLADIRKTSRTIRVKAGLNAGAENPALEQAFDAARHEGPPDGGLGWERSARKLGGSSVTVWKLDVTETSASEAARAALAAAQWMRELDRPR